MIYSMCECVTIFGFSRFTLLYFFLNFFRMSHTPSFWVSLLGLPRQYFFFFLGWSFNYVWAILLLGSVPRSISLFWALCKCFCLINLTTLILFWSLEWMTLIQCWNLGCKDTWFESYRLPQKFKSMWWRLNSYIYP